MERCGSEEGIYTNFKAGKVTSRVGKSEEKNFTWGGGPLRSRYKPSEEEGKTVPSKSTTQKVNQGRDLRRGPSRILRNKRHGWGGRELLRGGGFKREKIQGDCPENRKILGGDRINELSCGRRKKKRYCTIS